MAIDFACACGKRLRAKDEHAGRRTTCPECGAPVEVPTPPIVDTADREPVDVAAVNRRPFPWSAAVIGIGAVPLIVGAAFFLLDWHQPPPEPAPTPAPPVAVAVAPAPKPAPVVVEPARAEAMRSLIALDAESDPDALSAGLNRLHNLTGMSDASTTRLVVFLVGEMREHDARTSAVEMLDALAQLRETIPGEDLPDLGAAYVTARAEGKMTHAQAVAVVRHLASAFDPDAP